MACSGAHCTNHGTGTASCTGHRASCATNRALPGSVPASISGSPLSADTINALKSYMNAELDRYRQHRYFASMASITSTFTKNGPIDASMWAAMANTFFSIATRPTAGAALDGGFWAALISKYNQIRQDCICNADCACNLVCSCHNNCNCNYSDERLKEDISYC